MAGVIAQWGPKLMLVEFIRMQTRAFRTRSPDRDRATDRNNVEQVSDAITSVLDRLEAERKGLSQRVSDVLSRAAITAGNGDDEYLTRDAAQTAHLAEFESEITRGHERLDQLARNIERFKAVRLALEEEFPEHF
jgi:hypothetical protein